MNGIVILLVCHENGDSESPVLLKPITGPPVQVTLNSDVCWLVVILHRTIQSFLS